ncbi:MAG TPA: twin-arginine translocase TatA/TatE family subunit [Acidimicrobiales bacterium]|nr:twin-arginine translocase TatA/TatE family subunit [Acidimicrobiales bacterium]
MLSLSPIKLLVIAAVIMLLMGPDKLPDVAHKLGAAWRTVKKLQERVEAEVREAIPDLPSTGDIARIARSPVNLLNQLADRVDAKEAAAANPVAPEAAEGDAVPLVQPYVAPRPITQRADESALPPDPSLN